jgi:PAS domain S-box-containing protein
MVDKPGIVKKLRGEEKLGRLESSSQGSHDELEIPKDLLEDMPDENVENREINIEPTQYSSLSGDESVDEKELLFHGSSDMMLYFDTFGRVIKANKTAVVLSGYLEGEFIGKPFWKMSGPFTKQNLKTYLRTFKNTLRGKATEHFVCELNEKSGKAHVIDFSSYPIKENGKVTRILLIGKDVTEQKETEDRYCLITENTSDLITTLTFSLNPIFTYASPSHKKAIGYEAGDLVGKPLFDFVYPDDKRKILSLLKKYLSAKAKKLLTGKEAEVSEKVEIRFRNKSGNWRYMETTSNLIGGEIVAVSRDVTDRKKAEAELKESHDILKAINTTLELKVNERTAEIKRLLKQKDEFIGQLGHDLRNPLGPLINLIPILEEKETDPKSKEMFEVLNRNVRYMKKY